MATLYVGCPGGTMSDQATAVPATPQGDGNWLLPNDLKFDLENPRFLDLEFKDEIEVIQYLYDKFDVDELIQSILSAGYVDFEPVIVQRSTNIVFEGNRRLAALRLISREDTRKKLGITLPTVPSPKPLPERIRVQWVGNRSEARDYVGFKHINGPFKWDALAKAKYAAAWFDDGGDIDTISRTLGDNHNTVRRLVNGWFVLKQAIDDGFDLKYISKKAFAFSHLYTALTRSSVREFLGLTAEDLSGAPKRNVVRAEYREHLAQLMSWLYGQEQKNEPTIIQSQNPNLNQLSKVLGHTEARLMLVSTRNLLVAYDRVEPPSTRFEAAVMLAARQCEETMALSGAYDGNPTLLRVAEGMQKTVRALVVVMRDKTVAKGDNQ
jgi:hypothetical protein